MADLSLTTGIGERCLRALRDAGLMNSSLGSVVPVSELVRFAEALLAQPAGQQSERIPCARCTSEIYCEMNGCKLRGTYGVRVLGEAQGGNRG